MSSNNSHVTLDGNEAVADVAYQTNEVIAIYPITPASTMGEWADEWAGAGRLNIWGNVPRVVQMQSEAGAAGTLHGALQAGTLATTFTASQGLLLMIPNMYKLAGELTSVVFHVASRSVACQALSIFGDHSDVMATRAAGFALLASGSVQEAMDMALIAQAATLKSRVPFLHFFDGFRTSHEVMKVERVTEETIRALIDPARVFEHRARALSPDRPFIRGTAQNPDVFFQAREAVNPYYLACPSIVENCMRRFAGLTGREYHLFDYVGAPDAKRVLVLMGSGGEAVEETIGHLNSKGEKVGLLKVRLFRPISVEHLAGALPRTVSTLAALDRTKEPGSAGEPLYQDLVVAAGEVGRVRPGLFKEPPHILGGRYGLSSKEFTPAMVKGIFDEMKKENPRNHFTVGIRDDVTHTSLEYDPGFSTEEPDTIRACFYGLGSDGTVGANRNSIKIIGAGTDLNAQGFFVYDSKKAGSKTVSHLRFGPKPIHSTYLISHANFVGCHHFPFMEQFNVLAAAAPGADFLLNSPFGPDEVWNRLPRTAQEEILSKKIRLHVIDAYRIAREAGLGTRINTIMQTAFFAITQVLPLRKALADIKRSIKETYGKRGPEVVRRNSDAVDQALDGLREVKCPGRVTSAFDLRPSVPEEAPSYVKEVTARMLKGEGDELPVSAFAADGTFPSGTARWEKRNIALEIPLWDEGLCIQCGKCVLVCPHAAIRAKVVSEPDLAGAPQGFQSAPARWREFGEKRYTLQVAPEDCTGCTLCVEACPAFAKEGPEPRARALGMVPLEPVRARSRAHWDTFLKLPDSDRTKLHLDQIKDVQLLEPLFEFSGACAGCGETPYLKLLSQLFGDRALIANATGCSSIFGGNLPTTPWSQNREGRGPAWSNSLFEDNAEFGLGMRLAVDLQKKYARALVTELSKRIGGSLAEAILSADESTEEGLHAQRERVCILKEMISHWPDLKARELAAVADTLVKKTVWIVGGDGWAYDIGFGGLDHVLALGEDVNILVLDTEVYSNTGGQMSKATPRGAVAKFASTGKPVAKKDLGLMAMSYGHVYVASVAIGAHDTQALRAFREAESYRGPSLILAYSHCIAHGYGMNRALEQEKAAVQSGAWFLYRYHPDLLRQGKNPLELDSKPPAMPLEKFASREGRFAMVGQTHPHSQRAYLELAQRDVERRWRLYRHLAQLYAPGEGGIKVDVKVHNYDAHHRPVPGDTVSSA